MRIKAVVFDVGSTLVDEWRLFASWADTLGTPVGDFFAALGSVIERRGHHREVFGLVAPGADLARLREERRANGREFRIEARDLYPDAVACLHDCAAAGLFVGVAGNQPEAAEAALAGCGLPQLGLLAASDRWGVAKPDPAFFARVAAESGFAPNEIAYVGDRVDNDVVPARAFGMVPVLVRRGPWGVVQGAWAEAREAALTVDGLKGLAGRLAGLGDGAP